MWRTAMFVLAVVARGVVVVAWVPWSIQGVLTEFQKLQCVVDDARFEDCRFIGWIVCVVKSLMLS